MSTIYGAFPNDWTLLAENDWSEAYEVDEARVYRKPDGTFVLATASGCSCWDGDWEVEDYASLDDIPDGVMTREGYEFNPSLVGARTLMAQAKAALA